MFPSCFHLRTVLFYHLLLYTWTPGKLSLRITSSILFLTSIYFTLLSPLHMCSNWLDMRHPQPFTLCHTYFFNEGQKNSLIINKRLGENIGLQIRGRVMKIKIRRSYTQSIPTVPLGDDLRCLWRPSAHEIDFRHKHVVLIFICCMCSG